MVLFEGKYPFIPRLEIRFMGFNKTPRELFIFQGLKYYILLKGNFNHYYLVNTMKHMDYSI